MDIEAHIFELSYHHMLINWLGSEQHINLFDYLPSLLDLEGTIKGNDELYFNHKDQKDNEQHKFEVQDMHKVVDLLGIL